MTGAAQGFGSTRRERHTEFPLFDFPRDPDDHRAISRSSICRPATSVHAAHLRIRSRYGHR